VGSIYIKSSGSGSAASPFAAPSDTAEAVTSGSKLAIILDPLQQTLVETFNISTHLMQREKVADLRVVYADIQRVIEGVNQMELVGTWT
jgi:molybdenum cofactor biosynthesis enzyme MoaA